MRHILYILPVLFLFIFSCAKEEKHNPSIEVNLEIQYEMTDSLLRAKASFATINGEAPYLINNSPILLDQNMSEKKSIDEKSFFTTKTNTSAPSAINFSFENTQGEFHTLIIGKDSIPTIALPENPLRIATGLHLDSKSNIPKASNCFLLMKKVGQPSFKNVPLTKKGDLLELPEDVLLDETSKGVLVVKHKFERAVGNFLYKVDIQYVSSQVGIN